MLRTKEPRLGLVQHLQPASASHRKCHLPCRECFVREGYAERTSNLNGRRMITNRRSYTQGKRVVVE